MVKFSECSRRAFERVLIIHLPLRFSLPLFSAQSFFFFFYRVRAMIPLKSYYDVNQNSRRAGSLKRINKWNVGKPIFPTHQQCLFSIIIVLMKIVF